MEKASKNLTKFWLSARAFGFVPFPVSSGEPEESGLKEFSMKKALIVLLMLTAWTGCLEKNATHTLYVELDESVTWEVFERDVYSSAGKLEDRLREEGSYLASAVAGSPSILQDLTEIGGTDAYAELLRDRRPFSLRATARFQDLEHALTGLFEVAEIDAEVRLKAAGDRRILTITPLDLGPRRDDGGEDPLSELYRAEDFRFVVSGGEFEEAEGFTIQDEGRVAIWSDEPTEDRGRFRLVWTVED
jgi:hypothetical protein